MQCPACGATSGPAVTTACDRCGVPFDADATGVGRVPPLPPAADAATQLAHPAITPPAADAATRLAHPAMTPPAADAATRLAQPAITAPDPVRLAAVDPDATFAGTPAAPAPATPESGPLAVGAAFGGRYHIIKMLGLGGMGAVYQAWDTELEVALALKVIRRSAIGDPQAAAEVERRFKQELLLARLVTHPNVVRIHDLGEVGGIKYITMPYIQGTDLADVLTRKGPLPVREALPIVRQIAAGLRAAHDAGVVHRDLKPANIMIDSDGHALITDFGIARGNSSAPEAPTLPGVPALRRTATPDDHTHAGTVVGSIEYMAPEQARAEQVDQRADIYAFGLIMHRMLVGKRLAAGATDVLADLVVRMTTEPERLRKIDETIPEAIDELVSRCVQPDPAARFQTTAELVTALGRLDDDGKPLPLPIQLLKSVRFWTAAAVATIAIVATTWFVTGRPEPPPPDPVAVLVADFKNNTGEPVFDGLMEQAVTLGIEGASFISAIPRPAAIRIGRLINAGDRLDETTARLVALREGIKIVLLGKIDKRGSGYALSMEAVDPSSRKLLFSSTADARDRDTVLRASGTLADRVRTSLGDTRAVDLKETLSTASLDAASAYTRAQELSSAGKDQEAIEYFQKAVTIDPGFGRAHGGLAMSATRLGRRDDAAKLWQEALKHLDVMSEREQYRLLGAYYTLVTRNNDAALDTYEKLVKRYPADGAGHNNLAVAYFRGLQFDKALNEGRLVLRIYPNSPLYRTNYALYAMYAGNFQVATEEAKKLADEGLASYDTYLPLAIGAIAEGNAAGARDAYTSMAKKDASGASLAATGFADLLLSEGRAAEAVSALQSAIKADQAQENLAGVSVKELVMADAYGMQGNKKAAVAAVRRALAIDGWKFSAQSNDDASALAESQIVAGVRWLIAANELAEAERLGAALDKRFGTQAKAYGRLIAAQLALARGKPVEAVDALREGLKLADLWLIRFSLGQAYLAAGAPVEAFSEFEACLKRRGEGYAAFLDDVPTVRAVAPITYWMGRARGGMGLTSQAAIEYKRYIDGRAKDSPDPLLKDALERTGTRK